MSIEFSRNNQITRTDEINQEIGHSAMPLVFSESDSDTNEPSREMYSGIHITKDEIINFARTNNPTLYDAKGMGVDWNARRGGAVWRTLEHLKGNLTLKAAVRRTSRPVDLIDVQLDFERTSGTSDTNEDIYSRISLDSLIRLIDEFDKQRELDPTKATEKLLGAGFSDHRLELLRDFVDYKITQLHETPNR